MGQIGNVYVCMHVCTRACVCVCMINCACVQGIVILVQRAAAVEAAGQTCNEPGLELGQPSS